MAQLTAKEKAELTYKALQKRKVAKIKKNDADITSLQLELVSRCMKLARKRRR